MAKRRTHYYEDRDSGIWVKVAMSNREYEVTLCIPLKRMFCNNYCVRNKSFECLVKLDVPAENLPGAEILKFVGTYKREQYGLIKSRQLTLKFRQDGYRGHLVLNPKFYIPANKIYSQNKVREIDSYIEAKRLERARSKD